MKIAVLSGKGGTGKTFVSVNLACVIQNAVYCDCDVEEPNGRLFLRPEHLKRRVATTKIPIFDENLCIGCRKCVDFCAFHALGFIKKKPHLFMDLCHACGGCTLVCPANAVREADRPIGTLETGERDTLSVISGILELGEGSGVGLIQKVLKTAEPYENAVVDCPPGSSCTVMESIRNADFCILVVEGTAFGFHNFQMVYRLCSLLHKKCGVLINKYTEEYPPLEMFLQEHQIPLLLKIPYSKELASLISEGKIPSKEDPFYEKMFADLYRQIGGQVG